MLGAMRKLGPRERTLYNTLLADRYGVKFKILMRDNSSSAQDRFPTILNLCEEIAKKQDSRLLPTVTHVRHKAFWDSR